jgi:hypothetical protein
MQKIDVEKKSEMFRKYESDIFEAEGDLMVEITGESAVLLKSKVNGIHFLAFHRKKVGNESTVDRQVYKTIKFDEPRRVGLAVVAMIDWFNEPMENPNKYECALEAKDIEPKMRYHYWTAMGFSGMTIKNGILQFEFN